MKRSLNKAMIIGNLTRDPELRYTPQGTAVASFTVATNRQWTVNGDSKEAADFHNIVAWNKLAEICNDLLTKGAKVYVEGRLSTKSWTPEDGIKRYKTEIVIDQMFLLNSPDGADSNAGYSQSDNDDNQDDSDIDALLSELEEN
jgi:single-strand DNA-binding protein